MAKLQLILTLLLVLMACQVLSRPLDSDEPQEVADPVSTPATSGGHQQIDWTNEEPEEYYVPVASPPPETGAGDDEDDDDDDENEGDICPLCRDDFVESPPVDIACGHKYHLDCLKMFQGATGKLKKCFLCLKPIRMKDGSSLLDTLANESRLEVLYNKLKLGVMAGYGPRPSHWQSVPKTWVESGIYW